MIFVTVGTHDAPFDRLLSAFAEVAFGEDVVIQCGPSRVRPTGATCFASLPFERLKEYVQRARIVVTHAGVGSIMLALSAGKCPIVVPRRQRFAEHVDDHQLEFARRLASIEMVTLVEDPAEIPIRLHQVGIRSNQIVGHRRSRLAVEVGEYLASVIAARGNVAGPPGGVQ